MVGQEQGDGEGLLVVGQGDAHVMAAWPDVQGIGFDLETAVGGRRDFQFLVGMIQEVGALAQVGAQAHRRAQRRTGTVGADQRHEIDGMAGAVAVVDEGGDAALEIHRVQLAVEMQRGTGPFGQIEQGDVEIAAVHRPDHFRVVTAVALQLRLAVARMDHAPAHHHRLFHHRFVGIGLAQRVAPAFGQCQVDRAPTRVTLEARVAAFLVDIHPPALAGQQGGQQGAGQAGADDGEGTVVGCAHRLLRIRRRARSPLPRRSGRHP